jgi:hypothetical protein
MGNTVRLASLWDKNYHTRGLALHRSLLKNVKDFVLYVLCFEEETRKELHGLERVVPIFYDEVKTELSETIKPTRTWVEFLWTLTPSLCR